MKTLTTLLFSAIGSALLAQIPNPSFENWTGSNPNNWNTSNATNPGTVTKSSNAWAGNFAVELNNVSGTGGAIESGNPSSGNFVNAGNPVALNGWMILNSVGNDQLDLLASTQLATMTNNGLAGFADSTTNTVYKQFSACFTYTTGTADSASIIFVLTNSSGNTHTGSYAIIDDLSWGSCISDVPEISKDVTLEAAYPNPANDFCNIVYSIPGTSTVSVSLFDISGRKVMNILNNTNQTSGRYKIPVDVSSLANGIYIYTITVDGVPYSQKLSVLK